VSESYTHICCDDDDDDDDENNSGFMACSHRRHDKTR